MAALISSEPITITASHREKPDFAAYTAGKAVFGLIGLSIIYGTGNKIVADNAIDDPAREISARLVKHLSEKLSVEIADSGSLTVATNKVSDISSVYSSTDLVLDVETRNWRFIYYPSNFAKYRVIYSARMRLVDTRAGKILAEGLCSRTPDDIDNAPSRDALLANSAELLKQELELAADFCTAEFIDKVLI